MKRIFSILSAGVIAFLAASCVQEPLATFDPAKTTAPVLGTVTVGEKNVSVAYVPGEFKLGFNSQIAPTHSLALVGVDGKSVSKLISSKNDGSTLTATNVNISKALQFFGYSDGQSVSDLEIVVRATMQDPSRDNGRNGYVDSEKYTIGDFTVTLPQGSPYADYTEATTWTVIGALSNYEINWDGDLEMFATEDGEHLVAKAVTIKKDDQFKFRKDQGWDTNYGAPGDVEPYVLSLDTELTGAAGGKNLAVPADGIYDLWLDLSGNDAVITITDAYLPYPEHTQASTWSVIGALSNYEINWDGDLPMTTNGQTFVAQNIKIKKDDQFKFRKDAGWDTNFGAPGDVEPFVVNLGSESAAAAGGKNLAVPADGIYDLILDPEGQTFTVVETLGGGVSGKVGGDEPEPEPAYQGWGIIGDFNGWGGDVAMTEADGVWTGYFTNITKDDGSNGGFKLRKDADWAESAGGVFSALGVAFDAVTKDGPNIEVPAGFYQVVYDTNNQKITVSEGDVWSLIGEFNGWNGDVDMVQTDGKWVSPATHLSGGFKIRHNHDWALSVGGTMEELGKAFEAVSKDGPNIEVEEGDYVITYDTAAQTITVDAAKKADVWSVIGVNGDWDNDVDMTEVMPGIFVSPALDVQSPGWKVRMNHDWTVNRGGATGDVLAEIGQFAGAYPGAENINFTGKFQVVYNANNESIGTLGWGVVGKIASIPGFEWNADIPMNLGKDGKWYSAPVFLDEGDEIKVRWLGSWDKSYGGTSGDAVAADTAVEATTDNGKNLKAAAKGTYMVVLDPTGNTLTLSTNFWGVIGDFNGWGGDRFMIPDGEGKWYAWNQEISGGWKIRKGADWAVSAGGAYAAAGEAFDAVTENGPNIAVTDMTRFDVLYDTAAGKITVTKPVK